jgi:hypothetical protein
MALPGEKPLIIAYHAECIDGCACAWAVAKAFRVDRGQHDDVTYVPYAHHAVAESEDKIRAALKPDAVLYFVDAAPTKKFLDELMTPGAEGKPKAATITVLDHHETRPKSSRITRRRSRPEAAPCRGSTSISANSAAPPRIWSGRKCCPAKGRPK